MVRHAVQTRPRSGNNRRRNVRGSVWRPGCRDGARQRTRCRSSSTCSPRASRVGGVTTIAIVGRRLRRRSARRRCCAARAMTTSRCSSARSASAASGRPTRIRARRATSRRTCTSSRSRPTRAGRAATRRRPRSRRTSSGIAAPLGVRTSTEVTARASKAAPRSAPPDQRQGSPAADICGPAGLPPARRRPSRPPIEGLSSFHGPAFHTARWDPPPTCAAAAWP